MKLSDIWRSRKHPEAAEFPGRTQELTTGGEEVQWIPITAIDTSPFQARRRVEEESLQELAASIETHGVLQPIIVRPVGDRFELIVGERRWQACQRLGWSQIPAIVRAVDDQAAAEAVLIENLQRRDLDPIDEAYGFKTVLERFSLTQQALAERLGCTQSAVANKLRLLKLPEAVQEQVSRGLLSERHARALLRLEDAQRQEELARWAVENQVTVRQLEARIDGSLSRKSGQKRRVIRVYKDLRMFFNSLDALVKQLREAGVAVEMERNEDADSVEIRLRIPASKR